MVHAGVIARTKYPDVGKGVFSIPNQRYCKELEDVISVAKNKSYLLPCEYQLKMLNFYINELKYNNQWNNNDLIYWFAYNDERSDSLFNSNVGIPRFTNETLKGFSSLNLKNPFLYECTIGIGLSMGNNPRLTKYGWMNTYNSGATQGVWIQTNWATNNGINYTQNSARISFAVNSYNDNVIGTIGFAGNGGTSNVIISMATGDLRWRLNDNTTTATATALTKRSGLHSVNRSASNAVQWYLDGTSIATKTTVSSALNSNILRILTQGTTNTLNQPIEFLMVGSSYTQQQHATQLQIYNYFKNRLLY